MYPRAYRCQAEDSLARPFSVRILVTNYVRAECSRRGEAYVWIPQRWRIPALNLRDCAESDGYLSITTAGRGKVTFVHFRRLFVNFYRTFGLFVLAGCRRRLQWLP